MPLQTGSAPPVARGEPGWVDALARRTPLVIVGYFAFAALLRATTPGGLGLDEAEIMVQAQSLEASYGAQPPLYAWLQAAAFAVLGPGKPALALVKNAVLASAFLGVWVAARRAGGERRIALAAVLALALIPGVSWEAQRALAHTPLALATAAAALAVFVDLRARGGLGRHLLLGFVLGLGVLSYWSAVFVAAGVFATLVLRRRAPWRHVLAVAAVASVVVAPTAVWYLLHWQEAIGVVGRAEYASAAPLTARLTALTALAHGALATLALPLAALALVLAPRPVGERVDRVAPELRADLSWAVALTAAILAAVVLGMGLSQVKERWLTPVLFAVPLLALLRWPARVNARRLGWMACLAGAVLIGVLAGLQWNWRIGDGEPPPQSEPFAPLADRLAAGADVVLAENEWIGGNLLLRAPELRVLTPENHRLGIEASPPATLVWRASSGETPPAALLALFAERFGAAPALGDVDAVTTPRASPHDAAGPFVILIVEAR